MGGKTRYRVDAARLKTWMTQFGEIPTCRACGEKFKCGDWVQSRSMTNNRRQKTRRDHVTCLKNTYAVAREGFRVK